MHLHMSKELQVLGVEVSSGKFIWGINKLIGFILKLRLDIDLITQRATSIAKKGVEKCKKKQILLEEEGDHFSVAIKNCSQ